jgi:S1-C subfamily serine protease
MQHATWLCRAGWITAIGITLSAGQSMLAGDDSAADEQAPTAREADRAEQPTHPHAPAEPKGVKRAEKAANSQGGVLSPKYGLGAQLAPVPAALDKRLELKGEGLLVQRVAPGGPADKAGIKPDDILLAVGDKRIKQYADVIEELNASKGKELSLKLLRAGNTITAAVTPATFQGRVLVPKYRLGAAFTSIPAALNDQSKLKGEGLLIERVAPDGPAGKAGIKPDDILLAVGDKPIKQYADAIEALNASAGKATLKLLRDGKTITVAVTLDKHRKGDEKILAP